MEIQLVYLALVTLIFLNVHFFFPFRRQIRVFQSPQLLITSLALLDQRCRSTNSIAHIKPVLMPPTWVPGGGTTASPTAGPGKGPVCAGVSGGVSRDDLRAATKVPRGVTKGRLWGKHCGVVPGDNLPPASPAA